MGYFAPPIGPSTFPTRVLCTYIVPLGDGEPAVGVAGGRVGGMALWPRRAYEPHHAAVGVDPVCYEVGGHGGRPRPVQRERYGKWGVANECATLLG